ncbi:MAG: polysaccharide deacetylase family protein [Planctomycetota bacterium]|nr:polysaccharide deacetylase family protein [Planctomycetota bacterium]
MKTTFIPAYDTECAGRCLEACRTIVPLHRELGVPATFFLVTKLLEGAERKPYQELLGQPDFEVGSHTVTHPLLRDHPALNGKGVAWERVVDEVTRSKATIEDAFGRACEGFRSPCGFDDGLAGAPELVELVARTGYTYSSCLGWGPLYTLPVPLYQARTYAELGQPDLWEFPLHGWHENVLKGHNATPARFLLWPPVYPEHHVPGYVKTPEEEFEVLRFFIDKALEQELEYVTPIWHPWSLGKFDPEMKMLRMTFEYVRSRGCAFGTFRELRARRAKSSVAAAAD